MNTALLHEWGEILDIDQVEKDILAFWFGERPEEKRDIWFKRDPEFDAEIAARFAAIHENAAAGRLDGLAGTPQGCLALVIILDQFPRNIFRDDPRAFAADGKALSLSKGALSNNFDNALGALQRQFLYMPFQHSEDLNDQRRSVELFAAAGAENLDYAQRHLDIIERFGRFPHRNAVLGRESTAEELTFLKEPNSAF